MTNPERAVELEDFAYYCRSVAAVAVGANRAIWRERAEWADACAADFRRALEDNERLRDIIARASCLAESEHAEMAQQVLSEARGPS